MDELYDELTLTTILSKEEDCKLKLSPIKWMPVFYTRTDLPNMLSVVSYTECIIINWIREKNIVNHAELVE